MPTVEQKIRWLVDDLQAYGPERIILFGSAARGEDDEASDLDVVIVKRTSTPFVQRGVDAVRHLRPALGAVDLFVYTPEEFKTMQEGKNPFILEVLRHGKKL